MILRPTPAFILFLVIGLAPVKMDPKVHFTIGLLAITAYASVIYRKLRKESARGDEGGAEMIDSVYFLGFLHTMGVLGGVFLFGTDASRYIHAVGLGVFLTLWGLALRVMLSLEFGGSGAAAGSGAQQGQAMGTTTAATQQLQGAEVVEDLQQYVGRLDVATKEMATRLKRIAGSSETAMESATSLLKKKQDFLAQQLDQWQSALNAIEGRFGDATTTLEQTVQHALFRVGALVESSTTEFTQRVEGAQENLRAALDSARQRHDELNALISEDLAATAAATTNIREQSARQLQDLGGVVDRIAQLAEDVRHRTASIPNPADILTDRLQAVTTAAQNATQAFTAATAAAEDSARALVRVTEQTGQIPAALRDIGPGVQQAIADLRREMEASAKELGKEITAIDRLLEEFSSLMADRVKKIK